jgi:hypothetical protein
MVFNASVIDIEFLFFSSLAWALRTKIGADNFTENLQIAGHQTFPSSVQTPIIKVFIYFGWFCTLVLSLVKGGGVNSTHNQFSRKDGLGQGAKDTLSSQ